MSHLPDKRTPAANPLLSGKHKAETRSYSDRSFPPIVGTFVEEDGSSFGFWKAAASLSQWMSILKVMLSSWRWIHLWRKKQWRWIHLHLGKASAITSCLPGDADSAIGGAAGALHFCLGIEELPSIREPLLPSITPFSPSSILILPQDLSHLYFQALRKREGLGPVSSMLLLQDNGKSPENCPKLLSLQLDPQEEGRTRTGVLKAAVPGPGGGVQQMVSSSPWAPGEL